jgi:hypothetical protein
MEWLVPNPNLKVGKLTYDAQNYRGDFKWINEYDKNCNPDKNSGYCAVHRMVVRYSPVAEAHCGTSDKSATKTAPTPPKDLRIIFTTTESGNSDEQAHDVPSRQR